MPGTTHQQPAKPSTGKGKILPALCNIFGTLLLAAVIALCVPLTVPIAMGYQVYDVISGSMEPAIPVGSAIYVQSVDPSEIVVGDVVVLDLAATPGDLAKRVLDFSFGVASALDARVDCIAEKVFIICRGEGLTLTERGSLRIQGIIH